ncbi:MAG: DUF5615 family PIN-like protein [Phycisphaerae bacterium]|nr:DUF5615 family PIN-like protein [Saprospiraceae bacterium]
MRLLLDENLPMRLRKELPGHEAFTVNYMGWSGKKNGELLALMLQEGFEVLITFDKNLQFQQNFDKYPITVIVLSAEGNDYLTLKPFMPDVLEMLEGGNLAPGPHLIQ